MKRLVGCEYVGQEQGGVDCQATPHTAVEGGIQTGSGTETTSNPLCTPPFYGLSHSRRKNMHTARDAHAQHRAAPFVFAICN